MADPNGLSWEQLKTVVDPSANRLLPDLGEENVKRICWMLKEYAEAHSDPLVEIRLYARLNPPTLYIVQRLDLTTNLLDDYLHDSLEDVEAWMDDLALRGQQGDAKAGLTADRLAELCLFGAEEAGKAYTMNLD